MAFEYITLQRGSSIIRGVLQDVYGDGVLKYETRERERERWPFCGIDPVGPFADQETQLSLSSHLNANRSSWDK